MIWRINVIGNDRTTEFAVSELMEYLKKMDDTIEFQTAHNGACDETDCLSVGCCSCFDKYLPEVSDKKFDDAIHISVENTVGVITGTNPRSVLIAVYRYLKELGCLFIRPGKDNEVIPMCNPSEKAVSVTETASYRHRQVCIEGSASYEHVSDLIDWLPKISMNGYYMQFIKPYGFFRKWYDHVNNPYMEPEIKTNDELDEIVLKLEDEIAQRGLIYYAVGHSWNSEPFGIETSYWEKATQPPSEELRPYLAEIDGKRDWYEGVPLNTNMCYSNKEVQNIMTDYMVQYCKKHPAVTHLVVWLADGYANNCQCSECKKLTIADYYVQIINMVEEKLKKEKIDTKIVFSSRYYLPLREKINNEDRAVMIFYPIFRDFSQIYPETLDGYLVEVPDVRGREMDLPDIYRPTERYVSLLQKWREFYKGDTVLYDYLLIWFHYQDVGYMHCAKVIAEDIKNLKAIGLNGINSCQVQRLFFPTALPMIAMSETLWDRTLDFETIKDRYLTEAFGKDGIKLGELLTKIGHPEITAISTTKEALDWYRTKGQETIDLISASYPVIEELKGLISINLQDKSHPQAVLKSWEYLSYYPEYAKLYTDTLVSSYGEADEKKTLDNYEKFTDYVYRNEEKLHRVFDSFMFQQRLGCFFKSRKGPRVTPPVDE